MASGCLSRALANQLHRKR